MAKATCSDIASGSSKCFEFLRIVHLLISLYSITVAEMNDPSSDESLAASSIIMPQSVPQSASGSIIERRFSTSSMTVPSAPPSEIGSAISLLDVPSSSSSDDDDAVYEDSRSQVIVSPAGDGDAQDVEYVMLFDSSSEDD